MTTMKDVGGVETLFGTDPLRSLGILGGTVACYVGLFTTVFARACVPAYGESTHRRSALLLLLAVCAVLSVMSATATLTWLVLYAGILPRGPLFFSIWMFGLLLAAAAWTSRVFVAVDAGRWRGDEEPRRGERVMMMSPLNILESESRSTAPIAHVPK